MILIINKLKGGLSKRRGVVDVFKNSQAASSESGPSNAPQMMVPPMMQPPMMAPSSASTLPPTNFMMPGTLYGH